MLGGEGNFMKKMQFFLSFKFSNLWKYSELSVIILKSPTKQFHSVPYSGMVVPALTQLAKKFFRQSPLRKLQNLKL